MERLLHRNLRVAAERVGTGMRLWGWVIYGAEPWFVIEQSEAMFASPEAAKRIGTLVAARRELAAKRRHADLH